MHGGQNTTSGIISKARYVTLYKLERYKGLLAQRIRCNQYKQAIKVCQAHGEIIRRNPILSKYGGVCTLWFYIRGMSFSSAQEGGGHEYVGDAPIAG